MLTEKMEAALNAQLVLEAYASNLYLSMGAWCEQKGMEGCAEFMYRQSEEERQHMLKIFNYINETDGHALAPGVKQPPHDFDSVQNMFEKVYEHEQGVTRSINDLVRISYAENDHATLQFLQYYVEEQREEEALMRTILDKIKLIGDGPQSLYFIDMEVAKINNQIPGGGSGNEA
ncbi:MAG: ferritin [Saprospiraceae bacterium]|nr:ferritin [Saprospiraceae bacterium]MCB9326119.1 ferritin [Lewinellaceae bacterium]